MAKKFFYVCAGLLLLVAAYSTGASRAVAQIQNTIWYANRIDATTGVVTGRSIRFLYTQPGPTFGRTATLPPVPGTPEIVCFSGTIDGEGQAILADGSVYSKTNESSWFYVGNLLSGATAAPSTSWGSIKARYR